MRRSGWRSTPCTRHSWDRARNSRSCRPCTSGCSRSSRRRQPPDHSWTTCKWGCIPPVAGRHHIDWRSRTPPLAGRGCCVRLRPGDWCRRRWWHRTRCPDTRLRCSTRWPWCTRSLDLRTEHTSPACRSQSSNPSRAYSRRHPDCRQHTFPRCTRGPRSSPPARHTDRPPRCSPCTRLERTCRCSTHRTRRNPRPRTCTWARPRCCPRSHCRPRSRCRPRCRCRQRSRRPRLQRRSRHRAICPLLDPDNRSNQRQEEECNRTGQRRKEYAGFTEGGRCLVEPGFAGQSVDRRHGTQDKENDQQEKANSLHRRVIHTC